MRSLNNRHLKLIVRAPEPYNPSRPEFERIVRGVIRRGTVQSPRPPLQTPSSIQDFQLNAVAIERAMRQLKELAKRLEMPGAFQTAVLEPNLGFAGEAPRSRDRQLLFSTTNGPFSKR